MASYNRDTEVLLSGTFRDDADALVDPTEVTLQVMTPARVVTSYTYGASEVTRASLGVFTKTVTLNATGPWYYRFKGTGSAVVAKWARLDVIDDPLP